MKAIIASSGKGRGGFRLRALEPRGMLYIVAYTNNMTSHSNCLSSLDRYSVSV